MELTRQPVASGKLNLKFLLFLISVHFRETRLSGKSSNFVHQEIETLGTARFTMRDSRCRRLRRDGCDLSGLFMWSAGRVMNFSIFGEREVHPHWRPVEGPIVETHALRLGKQCIDLESLGHGVRQLRTPVPFYFGQSAQGFALAATVQ